MKNYSVNLPDDLATWVEGEIRRFPEHLSRAEVVRRCVRQAMRKEENEKDISRDIKLAWQSMSDDEIRVYAHRAIEVNMGSIDIRLNGEDAHRIIVELDHARAQRDMLNLRFQSVWLDNMRLKKTIRELEEELERNA